MGRQAADIEIRGGDTWRDRFPDEEVARYAMRAINEFWRVGSEGAGQGQMAQTTSSKSLTSGTTDYTLASFSPAISDIAHLINVEIDGDGRRIWLRSFEHFEHASLSDPNSPAIGIPRCYRLINSASIQFLPAPQGTYTAYLTYVPYPTQLSGTPSSYDSFAGLLDEWATRFIAREVALKQRWWDLHDRMKADLYGPDGQSGLLADIRAEFRKRDLNTPPRVVDETAVDRYGRRVRRSY